jgi:predicted DNA binding CopG/RHH family protein
MLYPGDPDFKYIDEEEKELIEEIEASIDAMQPIPETEKKSLIASLRTADIKKNVTMRLNESDLAAARKIAEREGLPYQTLISSVLHKYVTGKLVDIDQARFVLSKLK